MLPRSRSLDKSCISREALEVRTHVQADDRASISNLEAVDKNPFKNSTVLYQLTEYKD
jgi:hypothetical protein